MPERLGVPVRVSVPVEGWAKEVMEGGGDGGRKACWDLARR